MPRGRNTAGETISGVQQELLRTFPLRATSSERCWAGVHVNEFAEVYVEDLLSPPRDHVKLAFCLGTSPSIRREACGTIFTSPSRVGEFAILPAGRKSRWHGLAPAHLDIRLDPVRLAEMAADFRKTGERHFDFANVPRMRDPLVEHVTAIFATELYRAPHPAQGILVESLAVALCAHLLRSYTNAAGIEERSTAGVDSAAIRRAIAYIEDHPDRAISLCELASAAELSQFHFSRLFKRQLGLSPARFIERSRIAQAKALIANAEMSLAHVAQAVGFADQSHFSRRFRAHERCTPAQFARETARRILPSE